MARSSVSAQCDSVASYMDGVHVKIAEAYKPPRKVGLPAAYNNRFPDVSKLTYDFSLEKSVIEKITEWRRVRQASSKARQARLEEKRRKEEEETPSPPPPTTSDVAKQHPVVPTPEATILTPQRLSPPANDSQDHVKTNGLDLTDFDNDTSSPFDNMELKTINDMEELAQVLQPTSHWVPSPKFNEIIHELTITDDTKIHKEETEIVPNSQVINDNELNTENNIEHRSVSTIVQELQNELERPFVENWKPWPDLESPDTEVCGTIKHDNSMTKSNLQLSNPLSELTEEDQKLAKHLNDMGFPLSRAARAISNIGGQDNKKIVEYLLAVQALEEIGIAGDDAEKALALTQYDQDKARTYHENLCTLRDLGFSEDQASIALLKCNIDRDRALDFLIA